MSTPNIPFFQYEKEKHPKLSQFCSYGSFSNGPKNVFERAVVNEPSVFEPLRFYCIYIFRVITEKPCSKPLKRNVVYIPRTIASYAKSMT